MNGNGSSKFNYEFYKDGNLTIAYGQSAIIAILVFRYTYAINNITREKYSHNCSSGVILLETIGHLQVDLSVFKTNDVGRSNDVQFIPWAMGNQENS